MLRDGYERRLNEALALQIEDYWRKLGFDVAVELVSCAEDDPATVWGLRSNTLNGLPRHQLEAGK